MISLVSAAPDILEIRTTNPWIMPFLCSSSGGCQTKEMLVTSVSTTVTICGAPEGTVNKIMQLCMRKVNFNFVIILPSSGVEIIRDALNGPKPMVNAATLHQ